MFCKNCGKEIDDKAAFCVHCGVAVNEKEKEKEEPKVVDSGSVGWGFLGFFFPIVGLILYLCWKDSKPKSAKVAGIGALIAVIVDVVWGVICGIFYGSMFGAMLGAILLA
jgi:hypothetical protein